MTDEQDSFDELAASLGDAESEEVEAVKQAKSASIEASLHKDDSSGKAEDDIRKLIGDMNIAQKIKAAILGNATCRTLLVGDPIRMVALAVLKNPRLQVKEVQEFSRNKNLADYILREISMKKEWMSDYGVKKNLVANPKTPKDVSLKWLKFLQKNDLRNVARSREVSSVIATAARKRLSTIEKR